MRQSSVATIILVMVFGTVPNFAPLLAQQGLSSNCLQAQRIARQVWRPRMDAHEAHIAVAKGDLGKVRALILAGLPPDFGKNKQDGTLLSWAAGLGRGAIVDYLLDAGANVNARGTDRGTALHSAVIGCQPGIVRKLLQRGANPGLEDIRSAKPIDYAKRMRLVEMITVLSQ